MQVTEQASKSNGTIIETTFDDGSKMTQYANGRKTYRSATKNGMNRALYPDTSAKKCAIMDKLAAAGIR